VSLFFVGCASIIHQTTQQVPVKSNPEGAAITVSCGDVHNDPKLVTPAVVTVHRKPTHCTISLEKDGYKPAEVALRRDMSGWYLGNILFGGIIGLVVDAANGAMYNRTPAEVNETLVKAENGAAPHGN
jgi:hypothetical protein